MTTFPPPESHPVAKLYLPAKRIDQSPQDVCRVPECAVRGGRCGLPPLVGCESYYGYVETVEDAIVVIEACRTGKLPRVRRRLSESDRRAIRSGSVFVFVEHESRIKRWTDGKVWSPSRICGEFLLYRELEPRVARPDDEPRSKMAMRRNGLVKKTISLTLVKESFHLVCYYSDEDLPQLLPLTPTRHASFKMVQDCSQRMQPPITLPAPEPWPAYSPMIGPGFVIGQSSSPALSPLPTLPPPKNLCSLPAGQHCTMANICPHRLYCPSGQLSLPHCEEDEKQLFGHFVMQVNRQ